MQNNETIRSFVAVDIESGILDQVFKTKDHIVNNSKDTESIKVKWVKKENVHLTLTFLGNVLKEKLDKMIVAIDEANFSFNKFEIEIKNLGGFPNLNKPRVIWVGIDDQTQGLSKIKTSLDEIFRKFEIELENRPFKPHVTLGRVKFLRGTNPFLNQIVDKKNISFGKMIVDGVRIYKSELTSEGPRYEIIKEIKCNDVL